MSQIWLEVTEENIKKLVSCFVLATSTNWVSKYGDFWLFLSQNMANFAHFFKKNPFVQFARDLCFLSPHCKTFAKENKTLTGSPICWVSDVRLARFAEQDPLSNNRRKTGRKIWRHWFRESWSELWRRWTLLMEENSSGRFAETISRLSSRPLMPTTRSSLIHILCHIAMQQRRLH